MKFHWVRNLAVTLGVAAAGATAYAQAPYGSPTLMPVPQGQGYGGSFPAYPVSMSREPSPLNVRQAPVPAESHVATPAPASAAAPATELHGALTGAGCQGGGCNSGNCGGGGDYAQGMDGAFGGGPSHCWYASAAGMIVSRDRARDVWLSWDGVNLNSAIIGSRQAELDWTGGWEVTIGRRFGCDTALEFTYWGTDLFEGSQLQIAQAQATGLLNTALDFGTLALGGTSVNSLYATSANGAHLLTRCSETHSFELNLVHDFTPYCAVDTCGRMRPWKASGLVGVRHFQLNDCMLYATSQDNESFDYDANEAYYRVRTENTLTGVQLGGRFDYLLGSCRRWSVWASPRVGLYGNHIWQNSATYNINGEAFNITSTKSDVAVVGQLDVGVDWQINCRWRAFAGYRVVGFAGIAQPEDQVPQFMEDAAGIAAVDSTAEMILHGGFAGLEYRW